MEPISHLRRTSLCNQFLPNFGQLASLAQTRSSCKENPHEFFPTLLSIKTQKKAQNRSYSSHSITPKGCVSKTLESTDYNNFPSNVGLIANTPINKLGCLSLPNALFVINQVIHECAIFQQRFGYSDFEIENCLISSEGKLILSQISSTNDNKRVQDETIVVRKIVEGVHQCCLPKVFDDFASYYKRNQLKNKCNFKYMQSLIKSYCICSKTTLSDRFVFPEISDQLLLKPQTVKTSSRAVSSLGSSKANNQRRLTFGSSSNSDEAELKSSKSYNRLGPNPLRNSKKSVDLTQSKALLLRRKLSKSNEIAMQFSLKIQSDQLQNIEQEEPSDSSHNYFKHSTASTSFRTVAHRQSMKQETSQTLSITFCQKFGHILPRKEQNHFPGVVGRESNTFLSANLEQVQSLCEQSEQDRSSSPSRNVIESPLADQKLERRIQDKFYEANQWVRRVDNLFIGSNEVTESFVEGKEQVASNMGPNPEHLGKLARAVVESMLPAQPNSNKSVHYQ